MLHNIHIISVLMLCFSSAWFSVLYLLANPGGITIFGWIVDRAFLNTILMLELTLVLFVLSKTVVIPAKTLVHSYIGFPWLLHRCESALYRLKHSGSSSVRRWDLMTGYRGLHVRVRETSKNGGRFGLAPESANHMRSQSRHSRLSKKIQAFSVLQAEWRLDEG